MNSPRRLAAFAFLLVAMCSLVAVIPGCGNTPRAQLDRAEVLYGETLDGVNALRRAGGIDARTYVDVVTPTRTAARAALDDAKAALAAGQTDRFNLFLGGANAALQKLQQYRPQPPATTAPASRPSVSALPPPATAVVDPVTTALALMALIARLAPVAQKLIRGEELSEEERALAEQHSALVTAEADRLDAEARKELGR